MPAGENRSGAAAVAALPLTPQPGVLVVPTTAVLLDDGSAYVFRVSDQHLQRVSVELGMRVGQQQVILTGLQAGDNVVIRDVAALADGQAILPEAVRTVEPAE